MIVHWKHPYLSIIKWEIYSSFFKSIKHTVFSLKLQHYWMDKKKRFSETVDFRQITVKEPFYCEDQIFVKALRELYPKKANTWRNNKPLPKTINLLLLLVLLLYNLPPKGGRIGQSFLPLHSKHQIMLLKSHPLSALLGTKCSCQKLLLRKRYHP